MKAWNIEKINFDELYELVYGDSDFPVFETLCVVSNWQDFAAKAKPRRKALNPTSWVDVLTQTYTT